MRIRYTITKSDLLLANLAVTLRSRFLWGAWGLLTVFVAYSWMTDGEYDNRSLGYKVTLAVFLTLFYLSVLFTLTIAVNSILILARKHTGVIGEHVLALEPDELVEITEHNETRNRWSSYHRTVLTRSYAFLYITEALYHLVPLKRLDEGNVDDFLMELKTRTTSRK